MSDAEDVAAQAEGFADQEEKVETMEDKTESDSIQVHNKAALACLLVSDYAGAIKEIEKVVACKERDDDHGADHAHTLMSKSQLARLHERQGDYAKAEDIYQQVLDSQMNTLGASNESTLSTMNCLAHMMNKQGKFEDGEKLFVTIVANKEGMYGEHHANCLSAYNNTAYVNYFEQNLDAAEAAFANSNAVEEANPNVDVKVKATDNIAFIQKIKAQ
jgi:tetratricopeptide (TPR) repeat protein